MGPGPIHTFQRLYVNDTMYLSLAYASEGKYDDTMCPYKMNHSISYGQIYGLWPNLCSVCGFVGLIIVPSHLLLDSNITYDGTICK